MADPLQQWIVVKWLRLGVPTGQDDVRGGEVEHVVTDERGVSVAGELAIPREDIAKVHVALRARSVVYVQNRGGVWCAFAHATHEEARAFVTALGRSPDRVPLRVDTMVTTPSEVVTGLRASPLARGLATLTALAALGLLLTLNFAIAMPLLFFLAGISSFVFLDASFDFGEDGIHERRPLSKAFIAYRDIERVEIRDGALVLTTHGGRREVRPKHGAALEPLRARVERAVARSHAPDAEADLPALLREGLASASDIAALRGLGSEADAAYRTPEVPRERLWRVMEDGNAVAPMRARAAVALAQGLPEHERQRFADAVEATASPKVRVVLEQALATTNDERLALALAEVDEAHAADEAQAAHRKA